MVALLPESIPENKSSFGSPAETAGGSKWSVEGKRLTGEVADAVERVLIPIAERRAPYRAAHLALAQDYAGRGGASQGEDLGSAAEMSEVFSALRHRSAALAATLQNHGKFQCLANLGWVNCVAPPTQID